MNEQLLTIPCEITDVRRSRLGITAIKAESQEEINPDLTAKMMNNVGKFGWLCFLAGKNDIDPTDLVDLPEVSYEKKEKTHSQRLRSVLYVSWKQAMEKGQTVETSDSYYRRRMEAIIESEKEKLDR